MILKINLMNKKIITKLQFVKNAKKNSYALANNAKINKLKFKLYAESDKLNWCYQHYWLGEPILQTPEDIIKIQDIIFNEKPDIIFHFAAQPIVSESYNDPVNTYSTNILSTINIFESLKGKNFCIDNLSCSVSRQTVCELAIGALNENPSLSLITRIYPALLTPLSVI